MTRAGGSARMWPQRTIGATGLLLLGTLASCTRVQPAPLALSPQASAELVARTLSHQQLPAYEFSALPPRMGREVPLRNDSSRRRLWIVQRLVLRESGARIEQDYLHAALRARCHAYPWIGHGALFAANSSHCTLDDLALRRANLLQAQQAWAYAHHARALQAAESGDIMVFAGWVQQQRRDRHWHDFSGWLQPRALINPPLPGLRRTPAPVAPPPPPPPALPPPSAALAQMHVQPAHYLDRMPPSYPPTALRAHQQGTTILLLTVNVAGRVTRAAIAETSGNADLDAAALYAAWTWKFYPRRLDGAAVTSRLRVPVQFRWADSHAPPPQPLLPAMQLAGMQWRDGIQSVPQTAAARVSRCASQTASALHAPARVQVLQAAGWRVGAPLRQAGLLVLPARALNAQCQPGRAAVFIYSGIELVGSLQGTIGNQIATSLHDDQLRVQWRRNVRADAAHTLQLTGRIAPSGVWWDRLELAWQPSTPAPP